jgi:hypothetical protein
MKCRLGCSSWIDNPSHRSTSKAECVLCSRFARRFAHEGAHFNDRTQLATARRARLVGRGRTGTGSLISPESSRGFASQVNPGHQRVRGTNFLATILATTAMFLGTTSPFISLYSRHLSFRRQAIEAKPVTECKPGLDAIREPSIPRTRSSAKGEMLGSFPFSKP